MGIITTMLKALFIILFGFTAFGLLLYSIWIFPDPGSFVFGGTAIAAEHGGEAASSEKSMENSGDKADSDDDDDDEDEDEDHDEHAGDEADSDEHAGDSAH